MSQYQKKEIETIIAEQEKQRKSICADEQIEIEAIRDIIKVLKEETRKREEIYYNAQTILLDDIVLEMDYVLYSKEQDKIEKANQQLLINSLQYKDKVYFRNQSGKLEENLFYKKF